VKRDADQSRNLAVFSATSFLNDTASEMAYWVLPAFLTAIGAGPAKLGLIEGIAESVASFGKLFSGCLTDRVRRRKPIVVVGYSVANLLKPLLAIAQSWRQVLLIRFGDRLAKGLRGAPRDVMLAESVPRSRLGASYGLLQAMDSAGAIAGPLIALALMAHYGLRAVFWAAAVPGLACIVVVVLGARETGDAQPKTGVSPGKVEALGGRVAERSDAANLQAKSRGKAGRTRDVHAASDSRDLLLDKRPTLPVRYYYTLFAVGLFSLGNSSDMFLVLRAQSAGIAAAHAPLLGLVFNVTYTAFSWPAGKLADRISKYALVAIGYAVFAVVYAVFGFAPSRAALWAMMAFYGLFYAFTAPVLKSVVVENAPPEARGRAFGVFYFVTSIAALLSSILTGELWKHYGAELPFLLSAMLAAVSAVLLLIIRKSANPALPVSAA
jgi:MFS family permease